MRWKWAMWMVGMVVLGGCEQFQEWTQPTSEEAASAVVEMSRPVTKRLCAMVMIGNLGEEEFSLEEMTSSEMTEKGSTEAENELTAILNDSTLSEEEKTDRIDALIQARKAKLTPEELQELEEKKSTPRPLEKEVKSSAMSGIDESSNEQKREVSILNRRHEATSTATTDSTTEPAKKEEVPAEIESLIEDTLSRVLEESSKPRPLSEEKESEIDMTEKVQRPRPEVEQSLNVPGLEEVERLYAQQAEAFLQLNKNLPEKVKEEIKAANFQNYSVWMAQASDGDYYAVRYIEYVGNQFDLDYLTLIRSPEYKKWMRSQEPYLRQMSSLMSLDVWLEMGEVWHCD